MSEHDTIAAIATPPGRGAIAIVRVSGADARRIAGQVFRAGRPLVDRMATYGTVFDATGQAIDRGLALAMDAPRTVTGEDIVELHVHGSPIAARETLHALIAAGARLAEPGEFTRRAYINGKIDLSAAEAVADLIEAESRAAARAATANLSGGLRRTIDAVRADLANVLEELAGSIDFPDEVPAPDPGDVLDRILSLDGILQALLRDGERGKLVRQGVTLAIVGPPNAGKSSLLNALLGEERAIVSPVAGTTRDTIEETFAIEDVLVRAIDTAGLRASDDPVERVGVARARSVMDSATIALVVVDGSIPPDPESLAVLTQTRHRTRVVFFNKRDLGSVGYDRRDRDEADGINGSVFDAESIAALHRAIARAGWKDERVDLGQPHVAGVRQIQSVVKSREALAFACESLRAQAPPDLVTGDLLAASAALAEISGGGATEALLDGIFARFCIGK